MGKRRNPYKKCRKHTLDRMYVKEGNFAALKEIAKRGRQLAAAMQEAARKMGGAAQRAAAAAALADAGQRPELELPNDLAGQQIEELRRQVNLAISEMREAAEQDTGRGNRGEARQTTTTRGMSGGS